MAEIILSKLAQNLKSVSIGKLSEEINKRNTNGTKILNFTVGDFSSKQFAIPRRLEQEIIKAYRNKITNYSPIGGRAELISAISFHLKRLGNFNYDANQIIVASGARPLIYILFKVLVDHNEIVLYGVPSWNTQNFIYLSDTDSIAIPTTIENNFLMTANEISVHINKITLLIINSPSNPSGTPYTSESLEKIFEIVINENKIRLIQHRKPVYIMLDIIYWLLDTNKSISFIKLKNEIKNYVIFIDGISKCFASTGIRVGWAFGPRNIIEKMKNMLSHVGAWSPSPEQIGVAEYLLNFKAVDLYLKNIKDKINMRLNIFYTAMYELHISGYPIDVIKSQGSIYLAVKINLIGMKTKQNQVLYNADDILYYLMDIAKIAIVPFHFFGMDKITPWFRVAVGTCSIKEVKIAANNMQITIKNLCILNNIAQRN